MNCQCTFNNYFPFFHFFLVWQQYCDKIHEDVKFSLSSIFGKSKIISCEVLITPPSLSICYNCAISTIVWRIFNEKAEHFSPWLQRRRIGKVSDLFDWGYFMLELSKTKWKIFLWEGEILVQMMYERASLLLYVLHSLLSFNDVINCFSSFSNIRNEICTFLHVKPIFFTVMLKRRPCRLQTVQTECFFFLLLP